MKKNQKKIITINETARLLGISTATVRNWINHKLLIPVKKQSKIYFHQTEINKLKKKIDNGEIQRLNGRANKRKSKNTFIPTEYLNNPNDKKVILKILKSIEINYLHYEHALFVLTINLLVKHQLIINNISLKKILSFNSKYFIHKQAKNEIQDWYNKIKPLKYFRQLELLFKFEIPYDTNDFLGIVYQALLYEGKKSKSGSYYTPQKIIKNIIYTHLNNKTNKRIKILDPCCGTGQFLLCAIERLQDLDFPNISNIIWGIDNDEIAVRIAKFNVIIKLKEIDEFSPNIYYNNTLFINSSIIKENYFDIIITNPPWGVKFSKDDLNRLKDMYPEIKSKESYSYFLIKGINFLKKNGILTYILPESILKVKIHKDIREYLTKKTILKLIMYIGKKFKKVLSPALRIDLQKGNNKNNKISIVNEQYYIAQDRFLSNDNYIFDINFREIDLKIFNKVYGTEYNNLDIQILNKVYEKFKITNLKNRAKWALGVVTGNNKKFIVNNDKNGYEEIFRGRHINRYKIISSGEYIKFTPEKFQQVAPIKLYRENEKLIYRFISKNLIFAYDKEKRLSLNSANILIPTIKDYPIKVILALFNSKLYQYIYQKKYSSIKILKGHLEELPLPLWDIKINNKIIKLVDQILEEKNNIENKINDVDYFIMKQFSLSEKEIKHINSFLD